MEGGDASQAGQRFGRGETGSAVPDLGEQPGGADGAVPAPDYDVVVFENRFPSLAGAGIAPIGAPDGDGPTSRRPRAARCVRGRPV